LFAKGAGGVVDAVAEDLGKKAAAAEALALM
jgi:hypothetical protein